MKIFGPVIVLASVIAASPPTYAGLSTNGLSTNGLSTNGSMLNGTTLIGVGLPNDFATNTTALDAVRLVMPDGTELSFR